jgi:hypothetical protein
MYQHNAALVDFLPFVCQIESNGNVVIEVDQFFMLLDVEGRFY